MVVVVVCVVIVVCVVVVAELFSFSLLMLEGGVLGEVILLLGLAWFVFVLVVWFGFSLFDV